MYLGVVIASTTVGLNELDKNWIDLFELFFGLWFSNKRRMQQAPNTFSRVVAPAGQVDVASTFAAR